MWSDPEQYSENYSQKVPAKFEIFQKPYASIVLKCTVARTPVVFALARTPVVFALARTPVVFALAGTPAMVPWPEPLSYPGWNPGYVTLAGTPVVPWLEPRLCYSGLTPVMVPWLEPRSCLFWLEPLLCYPGWNPCYGTLVGTFSLKTKQKTTVVLALAGTQVKLPWLDQTTVHPWCIMWCVVSLTLGLGFLC